MRKLMVVLVLATLLVSSASVGLAQAPVKPVQPVPDRAFLRAPGQAGVDWLSGSFVAFDPGVGGDACFAPGSAQTFCFEAKTYHQLEVVNSLWLKFPSDWTVTNAYVLSNPAPSCRLGGTWGAFSWTSLSNSEIRIDHPRHPAYPDECTAYYCVEVVAGTGAPDASESWGWGGGGSDGAPHHPCSNDGYNPPGITCDERIYPPATVTPCQAPPITLSPRSLKVGGCPGQPQEHTLTVGNNAGYDTTVDLSYAITQGSGTCTGPASLPLANSASAPIAVALTPTSPPGEQVVCQIAAVDEQNPGNHDSATITKTVIDNGWDTGGWQLETIDGAYSDDAELCAVGPDGKSYFAGGADHLGGERNNLQVFDPATSAWSQAAPMPTGLLFTVGGWIGGKLYAAGGCYANLNATTLLQIYDPATNSWTTDTPMPVARGSGGGGVAPCTGGVGTCLYVVGGTPDGYFNHFSYNTYRFDPGTNQWTQMASMPGNPANYGWALGGSTVCGGKIYAGGDYRGIADFFAYDPATDTWAQLAPIPAPAGKMYPAMACGPDGNVYLIGGDSKGYWGDAYNNKVFQYDVAADAWTQMPQGLNHGLVASCALYNAGKLFTFGGCNGVYAINPPPHESLAVFSCPPENSLHLNKTKISAAPAAHPGYWRVTFAARVHDQDHVPVGGATVLGTWTYPDGSTHDGTCVTDALGRCKLRVRQGKPGTYTFCVTDIQKAGYVYDPAANESPACLTKTVP